MASGGGGEKTEHATPKRKKDERKKGNVFSSQDLVAAFFILIVFFTIKIFSKSMYVNLTESMTYWINLSGGATAITQDDTKQILSQAMKTILTVGGPLFVVGVVVPIIFTGLQTRFVFSMEALKPKFSRLNPIEGIKKLFSMRSLV